jgi:hypothetical protein
VDPPYAVATSFSISPQRVSLSQGCDTGLIVRLGKVVDENVRGHNAVFLETDRFYVRSFDKTLSLDSLILVVWQMRVDSPASFEDACSSRIVG